MADEVGIGAIAAAVYGAGRGIEAGFKKLVGILSSSEEKRAKEVEQKALAATLNEIKADVKEISTAVAKHETTTSLLAKDLEHLGATVEDVRHEQRRVRKKLEAHGD